MVNLFVWPWKDDAELLEVRGLLYPSPQLDQHVQQEKKQLGVNIVNTWKLRRCRIPHSITATADLIDAILHHDAQRNSASTIKAVYASALAKMVTSICDLEQDSVEKRSMMEQARKIGMPEDWVYLRHAITHGQTPGLRVLEEAVRDAVPWMWEHFWKHLEVEDQMSEGELQDEILNSLTDFRRQRRAAITAKQEASLDTNLASQISKSLRRLCRKHSRGLEVFIGVLVDKNIILPSEKQSNLKFKALVLVWNDLLLQTARRQHEFYAAFARTLAKILACGTQDSKKTTIELEMASRWLHHILLDSAWTSILTPSAMEDLRCDIVEACLLDLNDLTSKVIKDLLGAMSGPQAESLKQLIELCGDDKHMESMDVDPDAEDVAADAQLPPRGWSRPVAVWLPRPIGA